MARTKSSRRWLKEHFSDPYVKQAQQEGYRSRAAYKLSRIHERDKLFKPGMTIIDLGAAPGAGRKLLLKFWVERSYYCLRYFTNGDSSGVELFKATLLEDKFASPLKNSN